MNLYTSQTAVLVVLKTGVAGAAFATVLSETIAAILCIIYAFVKVNKS